MSAANNVDYQFSGEYGFIVLSDCLTLFLQLIYYAFKIRLHGFLVAIGNVESISAFLRMRI